MDNGATIDPVQLLALCAAVIVAAVLLAAAGAKLRDPVATADDFTSLGLGAAQALARIVPAVELATAAALLIVPGWGGVVAFALFVGFTTVLLTTMIRWPADAGRPGCACFGGSSHEPVGVRHVVRNLVLLVLCGLASLFDGTVGSVLV